MILTFHTMPLRLMKIPETMSQANPMWRVFMGLFLKILTYNVQLMWKKTLGTIGA